VKAAGINSVRLPCAWYHNSDKTTNIINADYLALVKSNVDYCINNSMYVMINIHWDEGWLENHVTVGDSASVNAMQKTYWTQIAEYFKDYDEHLLFACANEPNSQDDAEGRAVLEYYTQTFIKAVRATGGNNSSRTLIYQGHPDYATIPTDEIADRLIFEAHSYPYQFALLDQDKLNPWCGGCGDTLYTIYYWGKAYQSQTDINHSSPYEEEAEIDNFFGTTLKNRFVDQGVPVILGEYGAWKRATLAAGADRALHDRSVEYFYYYMVKSALENGAIPFCWDTGSLFDRNTGAVPDRGIIKALMQGSGAVSSINILVDNATITQNNGTLTLPVDAAPVNWSIIGNDTDTATINAVTGIITAKRNGTITVRATLLADTTLFDEATVIITNQIIEPTAIVVKGAGNASSISTNNGTLAMSVEVTPADAVNTVTWSLVGIDADTASLSTAGLLTAIRNGKVTVKAVSTVATSVMAEKEFTLSNQIIEPTAIVVKGAGDATTITTNN
jgi:hypothetical protein